MCIRDRCSTDPGGGFFAFRRAVVEGVQLRPVGYKMLTEIMVRGNWNRLCEFPYVFEAREGGVSNTSVGDGVDFVRHMVRLRRTMTLTSAKKARVAPVSPAFLRGESDLGFV